MAQPFLITEEQDKKIAEWASKHAPTYEGAIGGRYTFSFTPTGLGIVVQVFDAITKEELDVTDYDSW